MGLSVSVGLLAFLKTNDPEGVEGLVASFRAVNRVLASHGLPPHNEPETLAEIVDRVPVVSMPYNALHHLRRAVAYAMRPGRQFRPLRKGEQPIEDLVLDGAMSSFSSHIICHSDGNGFYVPIDFPEPLSDDLPDEDPECIEGGILGSSQGGLRELMLAAPLLDIPLVGGQLSDENAKVVCREPVGSHPHWVARQMWLYLHERLRQSVEYQSAVVFG
jgi:hypothetical protein